MTSVPLRLSEQLDNCKAAKQRQSSFRTAFEARILLEGCIEDLSWPSDANTTLQRNARRRCRWRLLQLYR